MSLPRFPFPTPLTCEGPPDYCKETRFGVCRAHVSNSAVGLPVWCLESFGRACAAAACFWIIAFGASRVLAFSEPAYYPSDPAGGGGGGRWFTGSPAEGYGCSVCHTGSPTQQQYPLYVEGLPAAGYVPGATYDVRLTWPEFASNAAALRQAMLAPSMGVVAELLAEQGTASGTIDIDRKNAVPGEICELPAGMLAMDLYSVKPGPAPGSTQATMPPSVTHCDANHLGFRCLLTVRSCGARELDFRWTAPAQWQGPIWFSAGFVATDQLSGTPENDSVREVKLPLMPATSGAALYESKLQGGCSAGTTPGVPAHRTLPPVAAILLWLVLMRRRAGVSR